MNNIVDLIRDVLTEYAPNEWVLLADLGTKIKQREPDFLPTMYGFEKLLPLLQSLPDMVMIRRDDKHIPLIIVVD